MQQIIDFWRMAWRRSWAIVAVLLVGLPLVGLYAYLKLPLYEAEARILVVSQSIPDELARSTVTVEAAERLQVIEQRLMARDNIGRVIDELGLYRDRGDLSRPDKIDLVREVTDIMPITLTNQRARRRNAVVSAFRIRVTHENPQQAAALANRFVTDVLDMNIEDRETRASETARFFRQEQARLGDEIVGLENRIRNYKEENRDALPDNLGYRQAEILRISEKQGALNERLLKFEEERREIVLKLEVLARAGTATGDTESRLAALAQLEAALIQQEAIKSPDHPEIRLLKNRIAALERAIAETAEPAEAPEAGQERPVTAAEVALRSRLEIVVAQMKRFAAEQAELAAREKELIGSQEKAPKVEVELNRLTRRLTEKQEMHAVITRKRAEAETGEKLEVNRQAERFEVIENAIVPRKPIAPDRRKIVIMGSGLMVVLAFGFAFAIDQMRPRLRSAEQLERQLGLRPVVTLPYVRTRSERRRRFAWRGGIAAVLLLGIPLGLYAVDRYYRPLPLLIEKLAERAGADNLLRMIEKRF